MSTEQQKYELIEKYLRGELTGSALHAFQAHMREHPEFATEVELHRDIEDAIMDDGAFSLQQTLQKISQEKNTEVDDNRTTLRTRKIPAETGKVRSLRPILAVAAMLVVGLFLAFVLGLFNPSPSNNNSLANQEDTIRQNESVAQTDNKESLNEEDKPSEKQKAINKEIQEKEAIAQTNDGSNIRRDISTTDRGAASPGSEVVSAIVSKDSNRLDKETLDAINKAVDTLKNVKDIVIELPSSPNSGKGHENSTGGDSNKLKNLYDDIQPSLAGWSKIEKNGLWGYIDNKGNEVINPIYNAVGIFSEGLVKVKKGGKWGYLNQRGVLVIPISYKDANDFKNGKALVKTSSGQFYIDKLGNRVK